MSVYGRSAAVPNPISDPTDSDIPPADIQLDDPLLADGTFIDAADGSLLRTLPLHPGASGNPDAAEAATFSETPVDSRKRSGKRASDPSAMSASGPPDWLPSGWVVEDRVRTSGATAGSVDKYYLDPTSGIRFRSKNEVLYFLETGTRRKKKKDGNPAVDGKGTPGGMQEKGSGSKAKKSEASMFDSADVPEAVRWELKNASAGTWTPFVGDGKVPESSKRVWAAAFKAQL